MEKTEENITETKITAEAETKKSKAEKNREQEEAYYKQYAAKVSEMEADVKFTITLFETGKSVSPKFGTVVLEDPSKVAQIVVSLFSSASLMWGNLRAMAQQAEVHRKYFEATYYTLLKKEYTEKGKKFTQKDLESDATIKNKEKIFSEMKWNMLYARITACKDAFNEQLRTLNMLQQMRSTELRNWGA